MKKTQQKNLLYVLVPSTILIVLWIVFSVYNKSVMTTISKQQSTAILPISPLFPTGVMADLKKRTSPDPLLSVDSVPSATNGAKQSVSPTPTPGIEEDQIATGGATQPVQ